MSDLLDIDYGTERARRMALLLTTCLPARHAAVVALRFESKGPECGMTLKDIGLVLGVTGTRIRQIEQNALRRLRSPSARLLLREVGFWDVYPRCWRVVAGMKFGAPDDLAEHDRQQLRALRNPNEH